MAFNIRPDSIEYIESCNFNNKNNLMQLFNYLKLIYNKTGIFAIDSNNSRNIKILPKYIQDKKELTSFCKSLKLNLKFGNGSDINNPKSDKTEYQETAVLMLLDMLITKQNFTNYKVSDSFKCFTKTGNIFKFLFSNIEWFNSCYNQAKAIYTSNYFNNLNNYDLHHNTKEVKIIRDLGSKLSNLHADKWNPSDIYLIKKDFNIEKLYNIKDIKEYNSFIESSDSIISISLKKGLKDSIQGSFSLNKFIKTNNLPVNKPDFECDSAEFKDFIKNGLQKIQKSRNRDLYYCKLKNNQIDIKFNNKENYKYWSYLFNFLVYISDSVNIKEIINNALNVCLSRDLKSCSHFKVQNNNLTYIYSKLDTDIKHIKIKLNSNIDSIIYLESNTHKIRLQLQSKKALPYFIATYREDKALDSINIKDLSLD